MSANIEELLDQIRILEVRLSELQEQVDAQARERNKWEAKKEAVAAFADVHFGVNNHVWHDASFDSTVSRNMVYNFYAGLERGFNGVVVR